MHYVAGGDVEVVCEHLVPPVEEGSEEHLRDRCTSTLVILAPPEGREGNEGEKRVVSTCRGCG